MALKTDCSTPEWIIKREMIMKRRAANKVRDDDLTITSTFDKAAAFSEPLSSDVPAVHPGRSVAPRHSSRQPTESRTFSNCKTATHSPTRGSVPGTGAADEAFAVRENALVFRYGRPTVVNGVRQRWLSGDHPRRVMGEDACQDKPGSRSGDDSPSPFEPFLCSEMKGKGFSFEHDQEFQYGPGIVDKLKTKFINLSLESERKENEGKLRRYSSLENLLENDFQATDFVKRKRPIATIRANGGGHTLPLRSGFKRAKSMETLLFESEQRVIPGMGLPRRRPLSAGCDVLESPFINENLVIIESGKSSGGDVTESKVVKNRDASLNRQSSVVHINDEELPKPDIVKTCKLIFEPAIRRAVNHNSARKAPVVRHSAKNWANNNRYASTTTQHAAITEKTEAVSLLASPKSCAKASESYTVLLNGDAQVNGEARRQAEMCEINNDKNKISSQGVKCVADGDLNRVRSHGPSLIFGGKSGQISPKKSHTLPTGRPKVATPKITSPVRNTSGRRSASEVVASRSQKVASKPASEVRSPTKEPALVKADHAPDPVVNTSTVEEHISVVAPKMPEEPAEAIPPPCLINGNVSMETEQIQAKEVKVNLEETEILKPSTLLGSKKPLWQKPPPTSTTMVFDFRGKDVKSHLPVNPAPFGCKPAPRGANRRKKRTSSPPLGDEGSNVVVMNGAINGLLLGGDLENDSKDYDDEDDEEDEFDDLGGNLPHPSGIVFAGGNVIVGKGSLLSIRNKKLKIQFNDTATSIYEYQSEASATDDFDSDHKSASELSSPPNSIITSPSLVNSPALSANSSGGLANYTPSMLSSTESFQLGVHRPIHEVQVAPRIEDSETENKEEEIKPADPDETSSWSSSTTSDLLF